MTKEKVSYKWAFKEYIWPRKKIVSIGLFLIIVRSLAGMVLPFASKTLIDDIVPSKDMQSLWLLILIFVHINSRSFSNKIWMRGTY